MRCSRRNSTSRILPEDKTPFFEACLPIEEIARRGTRHAALRSDEADGAGRSADRPVAVCGGATAPGESAGRQLQPGRLSESYAVRRSGARVPADSGAGECRIPALRADAPQHVHQFARAAAADAAAQRDAADLLRGTDFGRRRLCGIDRDGSDRGAECGALAQEPAVFPRETALGSLCHYITQADPKTFPAGEHHVRSAAGA